MIRATADSDYLKRRVVDGKLRDETYVFMKGTHFKGITQDRSLERMPFSRLVRLLAHDLERQHYHPVDDVTKADLLLIVHWGVTIPHVPLTAQFPGGLERATEEMARLAQDALSIQADESIDEIGQAQNANLYSGLEQEARNAFYEEVGSMDADQSTGARVADSNAQLLGLNSELRKESGSMLVSERSDTLSGMAKEERYFVILTAVDLPHLFATGKSRTLWTARISIRAAGVNFRIALNRLSEVGGRFFGTQTEGVSFEPVKDRETQIEYGELKVISVD